MLLHLAEVCLAEDSHEMPIEDQDDRPRSEFRKPDHASIRASESMIMDDVTCRIHVIVPLAFVRCLTELIQRECLWAATAACIAR